MNALRDHCHGYFRFARERGGIFRVLFTTRIRDGVPVPVATVPSGRTKASIDFLAIMARCLPDDVDAFARAAYLWAGLHGRVALGDAIPTFPWPTEDKYIEWTLEIHITAQAGRQLR
jgi:Tetracyclin repressor-like, C-terminal domain